jgi:hypothetical protein
MTLRPAEWSLLFVWSSLVGPIRSAPREMAISMGAAAAGWLVEALVGAVGSLRRPGRTVRVERIVRGNPPGPESDAVTSDDGRSIGNLQGRE